MRGTQDGKWFCYKETGIIPAYAGNTSAPYFCVAAFRDHPRVCGEHSSSGAKEFLQSGSSPRMRGTQRKPRDFGTTGGIIPAYAGNTAGGRQSRVRIRDHPRVCGEHLPEPFRSSRIEGSSPRMRGTPCVRSCTCRTHGIIPAYAGNTSWRSGSRCRAWDHPRVCGEHSSIISSSVTPTGSSPRMRGTLSVMRNGRRTPGIIPAYAGNTVGRDGSSS